MAVSAFAQSQRIGSISNSIAAADPRTSDIKGKQPIDYAKANGYTEIVDRLNASQYELTDRLTRFICGKQADHETGQHFLIPELTESPNTVHLSRAARSGMQRLPNHIFEELAKDVYDEVDRRETDEVVAALHPQKSSQLSLHLVPFLPVNSNYSSTRNQGRQKLARYNTREFTTLIVDIVSEARRRQLGIPLSAAYGGAIATPKKTPTSAVSSTLKIVNDSDSDPLYDEVPSDEDSEDETVSNAKQQVPAKGALSNGVKSSLRGSKNSLTPDEYNLLQVRIEL